MHRAADLADDMTIFRPADYTILVIDDEPDIVEVVTYNLSQEGYRVFKAATGEEGLRVAQRERPSLIVLDLMLPDLPGIEICRSLRARAETAGIPIIMLTARSTEVDRVSGFESGADDYVTKPFSVRELALRIRARLRTTTGEEKEDSTAPLRMGVLEVVPESHRVFIEGEEVHLSLLEFRLLVHLLQRKGRVQPREALLNDVWGYHADVTTRTIDTHIKRLRDKLGKAGAYVQTIRGVGYLMSEEQSGE